MASASGRRRWYVVETMPQGFGLLFVSLCFYFFGLFLLYITRDVTPSVDVLAFIDPLIGTDNGGHVFAGATLPYGMAKPVADVTGDNQGGFASDGSDITGFSHMHDSGTGGGSSLGNFPLFPYPSCPDDDANNCALPKYSRATSYVGGSVDASPGYFSVTLESKVQVEMTASNHTALYRFTFPPQNASQGDPPVSPLIFFEVTDLQNSASSAYMSVDQKSGRITGNGTFRPSFGQGNYVLNICADFEGAAIRDSGIWKNNEVSTELKTMKMNQGYSGTWIRFTKPHQKDSLRARVGLSFMSIDQACRNAEREVPDYGFSKLQSIAKQAWSEKLSPVQIEPGEGINPDLQFVFWSGIYRTMISPQDYTGENPLWNSTEPYYDSFYCIWDSFRTIHPLLTLIDPYAQGDMVRSLIDIYKHLGWLPDCRMSLCKGSTQGGSNADVVLVDAYLKSIPGPNWTTAYEAVIKDAEEEPFSWGYEGRGNLDSWRTKGYIPKNDPSTRGNGLRTRSISRTVEYAYNDYCIALMAESLGHTKDYNKYTERSRNWKNLYKANQTSSIQGIDTGFVGFLQPKLADGTWDFQETDLCSPLNHFTGCYLNPGGHETYEGSCWMYTFFAPGDMASLIQTLGGAEQFIKRLDFLHESGLLYMGDEQAFLMVYLYHYAGRPGLSTKRAHAYIPSQFNTTVAGIPGNDDSGSMGSFAALTMMGIFPNAGQDVYLLTAPFFESISITNKQTGNTATITNINFDPTYEAIYIQSATLDGKPYTRNWIDHSFFLKGGLLELTLGKTEGAWGTANEDLPPSLPIP